MFESLFLLNTGNETMDGILDRIPQRRVLFLIKSILSWFESPSSFKDWPSTVESFKTLRALLTLIGDVYGEHWESSFSLISNVWTALLSPPSNSDAIIHSDMKLSILHASLRLYDSLLKIESENEDLDDARKTWTKPLNSQLLQILQLSQGKY